LKRILVSAIISIVLLATFALPVFAVSEETNTTASVTVGAIISITLQDANNDGIQFGTVEPSDTEIFGDVAQSDGTPAIGVTVQSETNTRVDLNIKGEVSGTFALSNWKFSTNYDQSDIRDLTSTYPDLPIYDEAPAGTYAFYQWVSVPVGTEAGTYTATIYFKAEND